MKTAVFRRAQLAGLIVPLLLSAGAWAATPPAPAQPASVVRTLPDFTDLVDQVSPAVVNIRTMERAHAKSGEDGAMDPEMQEFFKRFFGVPMPNLPRPGPRPRLPMRKCRAAWARASSCRPMATS